MWDEKGCCEYIWIYMNKRDAWIRNEGKKGAREQILNTHEKRTFTP